MNNLKYIAVLISIAIYPSVAYAYVDPGTGAYLLQLLIALFGAVVFYASRPMQLFRLIREYFSRKNKK